VKLYRPKSLAVAILALLLIVRFEFSYPIARGWLDFFVEAAVGIWFLHEFTAAFTKPSSLTDSKDADT